MSAFQRDAGDLRQAILGVSHDEVEVPHLLNGGLGRRLARLGVHADLWRLTNALTERQAREGNHRQRYERDNTTHEPLLSTGLRPGRTHVPAANLATASIWTWLPASTGRLACTISSITSGAT